MISVKGFILSLNWVDIVLFVILGVKSLAGYRSGVLLTLIQTTVLYILYALTFHLNAYVASTWSVILDFVPANYFQVLYYLALTGAILLFYKLLNFLFLKPVFKHEPETRLNRFLGMISGLCKGFFVGHYLIIILAFFPSPYINKSVLNKSAISPGLIIAGWPVYRVPLGMLKLSAEAINPSRIFQY